jgi:16S rRNA G1207 methylase RsmC
MNFQYKNTKYIIDRFPLTSKDALKPWNSADELILTYLDGILQKTDKIAITNEDFGFLSVCLNQNSPINSVNGKSQEKAIQYNQKKNSLSNEAEQFVNPLEKMPTKIDFGLLKIPKSLGLFELYLQQLHSNLAENGVVICGFMTKYFTPQLLLIAANYFEEVEQSKAHKKARLLILKKKKKTPLKELLRTIPYQDSILKQYYGVFSEQNIDYATQFLIEELTVKPNEEVILDLASGNGILAKMALNLARQAKLHLVDDSYLAIASSKLNLDAQKCTFHHENSLDKFENDTFDLVVSNPPFHFEHQINMSIPLGLFEQVERCLKNTGRFILVSNKHLNYKVHLEKIFSSVITKKEQGKFVIYECYKS